MIVVATGPSASGKTTWCRRRFPANTVPEGAAELGESWPEFASRRWAQAVRMEEERGLAVCDDDPLKLHYGWSLTRVGEMTRREWRDEVESHRAEVVAGRLGFADVVLVSAVVGEELRRRRNFELHVRLVEPLREWYRAVEQAGASRVVWELPDGDVPISRGGRSSAALFDAVIRELPS
ncbi:hypothetical protein AB0M02_39285 [Actinoplanes sp. NPDC051861]|uniref:hypothetical protein n=1 Tax=Actinoplanes sp. NPDC051861 TaxID=3155170 RepID=UPI00343E97B7